MTPTNRHIQLPGPDTDSLKHLSALTPINIHPSSIYFNNVFLICMTTHTRSSYAHLSWPFTSTATVSPDRCLIVSLLKYCLLFLHSKIFAVPKISGKTQRTLTFSAVEQFANTFSVCPKWNFVTSHFVTVLKRELCFTLSPHCILLAPSVSLTTVVTPWQSAIWHGSYPQEDTGPLRCISWLTFNDGNIPLFCRYGG